MVVYKYQYNHLSFLRFNPNGIFWILLGSLNLVNILDGKEDLM